MNDAANRSEELLTEIRDLLREQNIHLAEIKSMNVEATARTLAVMGRNDTSTADLLSLHQSAVKGNVKYFIAFLLFMLVLLGLQSSYFRPLWRLLGL